jgi:hypothetical protein
MKPTGLFAYLVICMQASHMLCKFFCYFIYFGSTARLLQLIRSEQMMNNTRIDRAAAQELYRIVNPLRAEMTLGSRREGLRPSLSPILQIYAALKSSFVAVFAAREAIADGLNPLTISQTARTISCKKMGNTRGM